MVLTTAAEAHRLGGNARGLQPWATKDGLTVELWDQPKPAGRRLPWTERAAIAGRMPPQPAAAAGPRLLARQVARRAPGPS